MARLTIPTAPSLTLLLNLIFISCVPDPGARPGETGTGGDGGAGGSSRGGAGGSPKKGGAGGGAKPVGGAGGVDSMGGKGGSSEDAAMSADARGGDGVNAPVGTDAPEAPASPKLSTDVAPIVMKRCALAGCHDPVKHEHNMDMSTPTKIFDCWVNKTTVDHCKNNAVVTRVVPGKPEMSLVVTLVSAVAGRCNDLKRMPPPALPALPAEEVKIIRDWVAAGAMKD